jgi:hypothetical protein
MDKNFQMKKIAFLLIVIYLVFGCTNQFIGQVKNDCNKKPLLNAERYLVAPTDNLIIDSITIHNNCLKVLVRFSGCNSEKLDLELIDFEDILESKPPQRFLKFSLENNQSCEKLISHEATFDISSLQVEGGQLRLNIFNTSDSILYRYD